MIVILDFLIHSSSKLEYKYYLADLWPDSTQTGGTQPAQCHSLHLFLYKFLQKRPLLHFHKTHDDKHDNLSSCWAPSKTPCPLKVVTQNWSSSLWNKELLKSSALLSWMRSLWGLFILVAFFFFFNLNSSLMLDWGEKECDVEEANLTPTGKK